MTSDSGKPRRRKKAQVPPAARLLSPDEAVLLYDVADQGELQGVGTGAAWVHSVRSPTKTETNEDSAGLIPVNDQSAVLVVADGVGGHSAGEQASRLVVEFLREEIAQAVATDQMLRTAILNGLERANQAVLDLKLGAASTAAVVELTGLIARTYHVGDSGILICGGRGKLKLQTVAHAPVSYAVEAGILNEEEAMEHQDRHLVSNVVGSAEMRIEIGPTVTMAPRDTLILASDGLFDNLYPDEVVELIRRGPLPKVAQKLNAATRERMAGAATGRPSKPDDLSFILFRQNMPRRPAARPKKIRNPLLDNPLGSESPLATPIMPLRHA